MYYITKKIRRSIKNAFIKGETATNASQKIGVNRNTVNKYFSKFRKEVFENIVIQDHHNDDELVLCFSYKRGVGITLINDENKTYCIFQSIVVGNFYIREIPNEVRCLHSAKGMELYEYLKDGLKPYFGIRHDPLPYLATILARWQGNLNKILT